jgi:hypothetical protein
MAQLRNIIAPAANVVALIVAVAAVTIWSARLEHRVSGLESQVQVLATAPVASDPRGDSPRVGQSSEQACTNLAIRVANAIQSPDKNAGGQAAALRELMGRLGCSRK